MEHWTPEQFEILLTILKFVHEISFTSLACMAWYSIGRFAGIDAVLTGKTKYSKLTQLLVKHDAAIELLPDVRDYEGKVTLFTYAKMQLDEHKKVMKSKRTFLP